MSVLISEDALVVRREVLRRSGASLAPLAASLLVDLRAATGRTIMVPREKAMLSRDGGRCPDHGVPLAFDPFAPHAHRCPVDGAIWRGERHDRWWLMWYHLWLAERAVHAAALAALGVDSSMMSFAAKVLEGYCDAYLEYPNRDNVLGPSRPFFSTYLESIWLLQLAIAMDLLEGAGGAGELGSRARERIIEPSTALIASYDEGGSNRQVWNNAALIAGGTLLGESRTVQRAITSPSGVLAQLSNGLLADGTWYEGENYHLFAHRGLWYGVTMMERLGVPVPATLGARFADGFATPLVSALPDFTLPSRRDSQYAVSLRQWRFAESCELGLARRDDPRLIGALWTLYESGGVPRHDPGRWRSTAESERNEPATALGRADLGWRSLLLARETLPPLVPSPPRSALLAGQGLAVFRRDAGATYLALDYGHSGGGHGHPDRLNVILARGDDRWLDDLGTGSYVDPSLHWYRSTLAHNAPLIDGRSQTPADGTLRAYDERGGVGWVDAEFENPDTGVSIRRSLVALPDYAIDRLAWESDDAVQLDLPLHVSATARDITFRPGSLSGGDAPADGFAFVRDTHVARLLGGRVTVLERTGRRAGLLVTAEEAELWRASAPGAPGQGTQQMYVVRARGSSGAITVVWNWSGRVLNASVEDGALAITLEDGSVHTHRLENDEWHVAFEAGGAHSSVALGGRSAQAPRDVARAETAEPPAAVRVPVAPNAPLVFALGQEAYRRSEDTWIEAGSPRATVRVRAEHTDLVVAIDVCKTPVVFRAAGAGDPRLDNEYPDIHSDGVQLHVWTDTTSTPLAWLLVPEEPSSAVRVHIPDGARRDVSLAAAWHRTPAGYAMELRVPLAALETARDGVIAMQVVVNDMASGRERRRGQLVTSGGAGEHVYLRGDRESPARALRLRVGP
ncbi:MAG TPA: heparinase II/III family protein [Gemmatimonadaceae bacterium]|nr:heparinase II/III family protein [Gemmatimonadaceae bacterium]